MKAGRSRSFMIGPCLILALVAFLAWPVGSAGKGRTRPGSAGSLPDPLHALLSAAIEARGGRERLEAVRDSYSVTRIAYGHPYKAQVLCKTWRLEPDLFREEILQDGRILSCRQYDGKHLLEATGRRIRFGLDKDRVMLLENLELNRVVSLVPIGTPRFPASLGETIREGGRHLQELRVQAPSGITYRLWLDRQTHLIVKLAYPERAGYGAAEEVVHTVTRIDSYRAFDGLLVPDRVRIFSAGRLAAEVRLIAFRANLGLTRGFFTLQGLKEDLERHRAGVPRVRRDPARQARWKREAARRVCKLLAKDRDKHFADVTSYGDPGIYRERLLDPGISIAVDPVSLQGDDTLAFYADLVPGPSGFYADCIVLAAPPSDPAVRAEVLLHEATHAVLRRRQEHVPLASPDDEYLANYQADLFRIGRLLSSFERIAFDPKDGPRSERARKAAFIWRAAVRAWLETQARNRMSAAAREQFKAWCGVEFDLEAIRLHYIRLGVDGSWMPVSAE